MTGDRILRMSDLVKITSLSQSTIVRLEKSGSFPLRRKLSSRAVGWPEHEVMIWISESNQRVQVNAKERASDRGGMIKSRPESERVEGNHE